MAMANGTKKMPVCANGHEQPVDSSKFCIFCGVAIQSAAPNPNFAGGQQAPQPPMNQAQIPPANQVYPNTPPNPNYHAHQQLPPNFDQGYQQPYQPYPQQPVACRTCGGFGQGLPEKCVVCSECNWLRPLVPGYQVDNAAYAWAADAKAMNVLRSMKPLSIAAKAVSEKVGRRWIEVTFNGVRLSEKQMPHIYGQAVRAARILGMSHMPDVYLSGERPWDMLTFGSDKDAFVVVGSAIAGNFQGIDMLYLLAREMGHCKAGHALWKTVIRFFLGEQGPAKGFMAGGIFNAILSPTALIGGAIEMPLLAWARQAEITADRAGLLTVGSEDVARRVLLSWSLKSSFIYKQINIDSWIEQQKEDDGDMLRLSELTTSSTPYLGPRLKQLTQYAESPELKHYLRQIHETIAKAAPPKAAKPAKPKAETLRVTCAACGTSMRIPISALAGKTELPVKCPDANCGKITRLKKNIKPAGANPVGREARLKEENVNYGE